MLELCSVTRARRQAIILTRTVTRQYLSVAVSAAAAAAAAVTSCWPLRRVTRSDCCSLRRDVIHLTVDRRPVCVSCDVFVFVVVYCVCLSATAVTRTTNSNNSNNNSNTNANVYGAVIMAERL